MTNETLDSRDPSKALERLNTKSTKVAKLFLPLSPYSKLYRTLDFTLADQDQVKAF